MPDQTKQTAFSGDRVRIRKLADMTAALHDGSQSYFYITRLTSIKSLCRTSDIARRFVLYLADRTLTRMQAAESPVDAGYLTLAIAAVTAMRRYLDAPTPEGRSALRAILGQVYQAQSEIVHPMPGKSPVRLIRSNDLLLIEDALYCFTNERQRHAGRRMGLPDRARPCRTLQLGARHGTAG